MSGQPAGCADVFTGALAGFAGQLVEGKRPGSIPAADLADPDILAECLARHQAQSGGDWRAACSWWSQAYFRALIVPAAATVLLGREPVALGLSDLAVVVSPEGAIPQAFVRHPLPLPVDAEACLLPLLEDHVAPLIAVLSRVGQLSQRLLWENAAWPLAFVLGVALDRRPGLAAAVAALLARPATPPASHHALASARRTALDGVPYKRRLCCMRDRIAGMPPCAGQCPRLPG